jgi:hypothetical protein
MKLALIQGTRICEIADASFPVHADLQWVDVADDTTTQDTYQNGAVVKYAAPVPGPLDVIRDLEAQITPRRIREMATPEGQQWMLDLEAQIAVERAKL